MDNSRIPKRLEEYRQREYWDRRYEQDATGTYDWLMSYAQLRQLLNPLIQPTDRILNVGCGNSRTALWFNASRQCTHQRPPRVE